MIHFIIQLKKKNLKFQLLIRKIANNLLIKIHLFKAKRIIFKIKNFIQFEIKEFKIKHNLIKN